MKQRSNMIQRLMAYSLIFTLFLVNFTINAQTISTPKAPRIAANSYVLMDYHSETLLAEYDINKLVEPASITKMMTAYVVFSELKSGHLNKQDLVTVSEKAWRTGGSKMFIEVNKKVSVNDLLHGMIIQSGNDACVALAEHIAGSEEIFADLMNQYAKKLGMNHSHFMNATGLPEENHHVTAIDVAKLAKAIIRDFPDYFPLFSMKEYTFNKITQHNRNTLLWRDPSVDGFKTGHTQAAGYCLVASAERNGMRLISVVMGTESQKARADESQKLFNYGFRFYETNLLYKAGEKRVSIEVYKGEEEHLNLGIKQDLYVTIPKGQYKKLSAKVDMPDYLIAPVLANQVIGKLNVQLNNKILASKNLIALKPIVEGSWWSRTVDSMALWFK